MLSRKHIVPFFVLLWLIAGCGGAPAKTGKRTAPRVPKFEQIELPAEVTAATRSRWEKELLLLPAEHPRRLELRDLVAAHYAAEFDAVDEARVDERLRLFVEALALHEPGDFAPGRVAEPLVGPARWVADTFERRGEESTVLAALRFVMLAVPDDKAIEERYLELADWSESVRQTIPDEMDRLSSKVAVYSRMVRMVPDREVVDRLAELLVSRQKLLLDYLQQLEDEGTSVPPFLLRAILQEGGMAKELLHIYFLAGEPTGAIQWMEGLVAGAEVGGEYLDLLRDMAEGKHPAENYFALAGRLGPDEPRSGLRACVRARALDRTDPRFPICIGRFYEELERPECAVDFYVEATEVTPEEDVFTEAIQHVRRALYEVHRVEKQDEAARVVEVADALVERALKLEDVADGDLPPSAAHLLYTAGLVDFDDGRIDAAIAHFERAEQIWPALVLAPMKVAEIHRLRGKHQAAIDVLDKVLDGDPRREEAPSPYWRAILLERRGDCRVALAGADAGRSDYEAALEEWNKADIPLPQAPEAAVRQGVLQDRLGDLEASQTAFKLAIRLDPDRRATYAELISFLVVRGRIEPAKEFYRLAFNQDRIEPMWKIYYSLWVVGLARRDGGKGFELAQGYLAQSDGESWQDELARYFSDRITLEQLRERATNVGQRVEVDYYAALKLLAADKKTEARPMLEKVIKSDLMGFFEYRMARELLDTEF